MTRKKRTASVTAGVLAVAIVLTGTFAWTSISQEAKNEIVHTVNPGGRLHDDFNGDSKDVYVENFMSTAQGGQPIFARIRLDEYMEVGKNAGDKANRTGVKIFTPNGGTTPKLDDVTTWITHKPTADDVMGDTVDVNGESIHDRWGWTLGGKTVFMPTFNKDNTSLDADINGTWQGKNGEPFDDYVEYKAGDTLKAAAEYKGGVTKTETHTAKDTLTTAGVLTMKQWKNLGCPIGPYWVYDADGWAYWAQGIAPGTATGLLLDGISYVKDEAEGADPCYYGINVVGQFCTKGDWGKPADAGAGTPGTGFYEDAARAPSDNALTLLKLVSGYGYEIEVTEKTGKTTAAPGDTLNFTAALTVGKVDAEPGTALAKPQPMTWSVLGNEKATTIDEKTGVLKVAADESAASLTVRATAWNGVEGEITVHVTAASGGGTPGGTSDVGGEPAGLGDIPTDPAGEEPGAGEPSVEEPTVEEPAVEEPSVEGPAVDEPAVVDPEVPAGDPPADTVMGPIEDAAASVPAEDEPTADEPVTNEPAVTAPESGLAPEPAAE